MIKKILVPQDGSAHGRAALTHALWLADRFSATLIGQYVVDVVSLEGPFLHDLSASIGFEPFLNFSAKMREALEDKGKEILSSFIDECRAAGVEAETVVSSGIVPNEICEQSRLADLVVIGRLGVNEKYSTGMLGSVAEGVVRKSSRPVLMVPKEFKEPSSAVLAYDGSKSASNAMHSAAEWTKALGLPLAVVVVSDGDGPDARLKDAEDYLEPYGIEAHFVQLKGDVPEGITRHAKEKGCDLLFMGATHHSRIMEMVLGSTTEYVMRSVACPVLIQR